MAESIVAQLTEPRQTKAKNDLSPHEAAVMEASKGSAEQSEPTRQFLKIPLNAILANDRERFHRPASQAFADESSSDFPATPVSKTKGRLWIEGAPPHQPSPAGNAFDTQLSPWPQKSSRKQAPIRSILSRTPEEEDPPVSAMIKQPATRPISEEQLVAEVKGIYAGLVMVESKCIEVDSAQSAQTGNHLGKLTSEQWQALIALHRTLLHEHHDFFLASQHPSANPLHEHHDFFLASQHPSANPLHEHHDFFLGSRHPSANPSLRRLASKYAMPARMWRHGIHSFLELLRIRLPDSLEHMLTFIYLA